MNKKILFIISLFAILFILTGCIKEEMKVEKIEENNSTKVKEFIVEETTIELEENDDFTKILNNIKNTHPGTAGCTLQSLYNAVDLLNIAKARMNFDAIIDSFITSIDKESYQDINDSFSLLFDSLNDLQKNDDKKILDDNDIENNAPYDKLLYDEAIRLINIIIEKTK